MGVGSPHLHPPAYALGFSFALALGGCWGDAVIRGQVDSCPIGSEGCRCGEGCELGLECNDFGWCTKLSCGNDMLDEGEVCDPGESVDPRSGCLSTCERPRSCLEIREHYADAALDDDLYLLYPEGLAGGPWTTRCDMNTEGGGWTELALADVCGAGELEGRLPGELSLLEASTNTSVSWLLEPDMGELRCRPASRDVGAGWHVAYLDIPFPPSFSEFYLADFHSRANADLVNQPSATCELLPASGGQTRWVWTPGEAGDISFGIPDARGPRTSYGRYTIDDYEPCGDCEVVFPGDRQIFGVEASETLRISWGEAGLESEGWYPWWSGSIYLR